MRYGEPNVHLPWQPLPGCRDRFVGWLGRWFWRGFRVLLFVVTFVAGYLAGTING